MINLLKKCWKNKITAVFVILTLIMAPITVFYPTDKSSKAIVTSIGIDYVENVYELSVLSVVPKSSAQSLSNVELTSAKGGTIAETLIKISYILGKKIGLAHCETILMSNEVMQTDILNVLNYFSGSNNLTYNALLVNVDGSSKEALESSIGGESTLDINLNQLLSYNGLKTFASKANIENFFKSYYSESQVFYVPIISVKEMESNTSSSSGSSSESGSGSSSSSSTPKKKIDFDGSVALIKNGIKIKKFSQSESDFMNLITPYANVNLLTANNVTNEFVSNAKIDVDIITKLVTTEYSFENDKPTVTYGINLIVKLDETSENNYSYLNAYRGDDQITNEVVDKLIETINEKKDSLLIAIVENNADILNIERHLSRYHPKLWTNYLSTLNSAQSFLNDIMVNLNITIRGKV